MSSEVFAKLMVMIFMAATLSYIVFSTYDEEVGVEHIESQRRFVPYVNGALLPCALFIILIATYLKDGPAATLKHLLSMYFNLFVHISFFYTILILLLPILRKHMIARSLSFLWMIPNYLYILGYRFMLMDKPLLILEIPENIVIYILIIIIIGAIAFLMAKMISHFQFRRYVLKDAYPVSDEKIVDVWNEVIAWANIKKPKFKLVVSSNVTSPLSIGLFQRTTRVVLPKQSYTKEELTYIFKHEIIHICREDVWSKFFLMLCNALCWYNPLMWIASKKCSDDIELSCDESVLINMDQNSRKEYARLILNTVADERGLTTCLSASAQALKYRLSNIMKPRTHRSGAIIVGISFFLLSMTSGFVALAYDQHSGAEGIFHSQDTSLYSIVNIRSEESPYDMIIRCEDEEKFNQYLSDLKMRSVTGYYTYDMYDKNYSFVYTTPQGYKFIFISDEVVKVDSEYYYLKDKINWDEFETMIVPYPALNIHYWQDDAPYHKTLSASLMKVEDHNQIIYDATALKDETYGLYTSQLPHNASLSFSYENVMDYQILVESWDYKTNYTIEKSELAQNGIFELPQYPAHYTVFATMKNKQGEIIDAEFTFNINEMPGEMGE